MSPADAFAALAAGIGAYAPAAAFFTDEELGRWPTAAVAAMKAQRLIASAPRAASVICPGCEEHCLMPVNVPGDDAVRTDPFVVCDKRSDMNRVAISAASVRQWRAADEGLCRFVADTLGLRRTATPSADAALVNIGIAQGSRRAQMLVLRAAGEPSLVVATSSLPLPGIVTFDGSRFGLDGKAIARLIDSATTADDRYTPTCVRREARRVETQRLHEEWSRLYRRLQREQPGRSAVWYSKRIAALPAGRGYAADTIRKNMVR